MIRRAFFAKVRLRGSGVSFFLTTPGSEAVCCRFSATGNAPLCPVVGAAPETRCPLESGPEPGAKVLPPTHQLVAQMGKLRLSAFVTATAVVGYVISFGTSPAVASLLTAGTLFQSCSANTANQIIEMEHDKKMKRTCRRPLPMGYISPVTASLFCAVELLIGSGILYSVSPPVAALGFINWVIYVFLYTPLKRFSAVNTWVGSIVGGIPPLMGSVAASGALSAPGCLLAALLVVWQIPHFMGLSFFCRRDYEAAGYKMLAFYNPWRASFYAVLFSVLMVFLTLPGLFFVGVSPECWYYPIVAAANGVMIYKAWLFYCEPKQHCRGCFVFSYVYLAIVLMALMVNHFEPVKKSVALYNSFTSGFPLEGESEAVSQCS